MQKLLEGIVEFERDLSPAQRKRLTQLALGQKPDAFLLACCDSRVAPNVFASTKPGDLFVARNVGNLVPRSTPGGRKGAPRAVGAALEFALHDLKVKDIIVCGHSQCGAMVGALQGGKRKGTPNLSYWLEQIRPTVRRLRANPRFARGLAEHDRLSQLSVVVQLENLMTYSLIADRVEKGDLRLHGWWFNLKEWSVFYLDASRLRFKPIDQDYVRQHAF